MKIYINPPRKDNKNVVVFAFANGKRFTRVVPSKEFPSLKDLIQKYRNSEIIYKERNR